MFSIIGHSCTHPPALQQHICICILLNCPLCKYVSGCVTYARLEVPPDSHECTNHCHNQPFSRIIDQACGFFSLRNYLPTRSKAFCKCLYGQAAVTYRFPSDHRSQAPSSGVSTWMGDHPGTPRAVGNTWCTRHMAKPRPQVGRVC